MAAAKKKVAAPSVTDETALSPALARLSYGALADKLLDLRNKRLALESDAEELKKQETQIKEHLIREMPKADLRKLVGKYASVSLRSKEMPHIVDWDAFRKYLKRKDAFDLLQKRTSPDAFRERWEAGEEIPGVEKFNVLELSVTKSA